MARYPFESGHSAESYSEVVQAIDDIAASEHSYQTLVIDTVDALEPLLWRMICERDSTPDKPIRSIDDYGYGRGYSVALDEWNLLLAKLDRLRRSRSMDVVLVAHSAVKGYRNPEGDDYDRYELAVQHSGRVSAARLMVGWADVVGFVSFEDRAVKLGDDRVRGRTGKRVIHFERTAAYDAKSRIALPATVDLPHSDGWAPIRKALEDQTLTAEAVQAKIDAELKRIGSDDLTQSVQRAISAEAKGSVPVLIKYLQNLRLRQAGAKGKER